MNIVELQQFAKLASIETKQISVYIKRGKIIPEKIIGEGKGRSTLIDAEHPVNKLFIQSRAIMSIKKGLQVATPAEVITKKADKQSVSQPDKQQIDLTDSIIFQDIDEEPSNNAVTLDLQLKQAELRIRYQKEKLNDIVIDKAEGELIRTDIVGRAVSEVVQRYKASFTQNVDQLIRDALNSVQADNVLLTETLSKLTEIANDVSERANFEAKIAIEDSISNSLSLKK